MITISSLILDLNFVEIFKNKMKACCWKMLTSDQYTICETDLILSELIWQSWFILWSSHERRLSFSHWFLLEKELEKVYSLNVALALSRIFYALFQLLVLWKLHCIEVWIDCFVNDYNCLLCFQWHKLKYCLTWSSAVQIQPLTISLLLEKFSFVCALKDAFISLSACFSSIFFLSMRSQLKACRFSHEDTTSLVIDKTSSE